MVGSIVTCVMDCPWLSQWKSIKHRELVLIVSLRKCLVRSVECYLCLVYTYSHDIWSFFCSKILTTRLNIDFNMLTLFLTALNTKHPLSSQLIFSIAHDIYLTQIFVWIHNIINMPITLSWESKFKQELKSLSFFLFLDSFLLFLFRFTFKVVISCLMHWIRWVLVILLTVYFLNSDWSLLLM